MPGNLQNSFKGYNVLLHYYIHFLYKISSSSNQLVEFQLIFSANHAKNNPPFMDDAACLVQHGRTSVSCVFALCIIVYVPGVSFSSEYIYQNFECLLGCFKGSSTGLLCKM